MPIVPVLLLIGSLLAPSTSRIDGPRPGIDVLRYRFAITLSDHSNVIDGRAQLAIRFTQQPKDFYLDLVSRKSNDTGMKVQGIRMDGIPIRFDHENDRLWIRLDDGQVDSVVTFEILYRGVPADGLVISQNRYGDRTFFADNWPNRARHWIPTVDHPADKAYVDFVVTAPDQYQVISNGDLVEETDVSPGLRITHWSSTEVIPTKVMVIGVARFAVQYLGKINGVSLQTWVYPQARSEGFYDFAVGEPALRLFNELLGPFPFSKLANVQSTTRYGGMENASAIFYDENSVSGTRRQEEWVAHEIAHQWFGDSASEADWPDVWLSEGFATFFAHLYFERYYGRERLIDRMKIDRRAIIRYATANPTSSVVDMKVSDPNRLLNINTYEKGSWILHMLRAMLGEDKFWDVLHRYYQEYRYANATTADFQRVAESVAGADLSWFFDQWIYRPGVPELKLRWRYEGASGEIILDVEQAQMSVYRLPLEIEINSGSGRVTESVEITSRQQSFRIKSSRPPEALRFDPNVTLLARMVTE